MLEKMLTRYEEASKHVMVEKKDPVLYPNFTSQYTDAQVSDNSLIVVHEDKSKVIDYNSLYEMEYDYYTGSGGATGFDGEGQIDSAISYVTSDDLPILYTLQGHGELELNSSLKRKSGESELPDRNTEPSFGRKCSRGYGMPYDNGSADGSFRRRGRENHYLSGTGWESHDLYRLYIC